jgi:hypothetical protein
MKPTLTPSMKLALAFSTLGTVGAQAETITPGIWTQNGVRFKVAKAVRISEASIAKLVEIGYLAPMARFPGLHQITVKGWEMFETIRAEMTEG